MPAAGGWGTLRILVLTPYSPDSIGGISSFVRTLSAGLRSNGDEVRESSPRPSTAGGAVESIFSHSIRVSREIVEYDPDVIHAHGTWRVSPAVFLHPDRRTVFTFHTEPLLDRPWTRSAIRALANRANACTAPTRYLKKKIESVCPGIQLEVIPPTIPEPTGVTLTKDDARVRLGIPPSGPLLSFMSPMAYWEKVSGLRVLFEVLPDMPPDVRVAVAGSGPLLGDVQRIARELGVHMRVHFLGSLADVSALLAATDVYVHPSFKDNLPLALLEAMARGIPCVAFPVGGIPEAVEHGVTGLLSDPTADSLRGNLLRLLGNPEFARMIGGTARAAIQRRFSWSEVSPSWRRAYGG